MMLAFAVDRRLNRMVAGSSEPIGAEWFLVAEVCNHPNCLVLPFRFPMVRAAA
jgi:hypothetical protein